jgi:hypothetical protein
VRAAEDLLTPPEPRFRVVGGPRSPAPKHSLSLPCILPPPHISQHDTINFRVITSAYPPRPFSFSLIFFFSFIYLLLLLSFSAVYSPALVPSTRRRPQQQASSLPAILVAQHCPALGLVSSTAAPLLVAKPPVRNQGQLQPSINYRLHAPITSDRVDSINTGECRQGKVQLTN